MKGPSTPGGGHYRCVSEMTQAAARVSSPDGWEIKELPARCDGESVEPGEWVAISQDGSRVNAATPERLLSRLWTIEARRVEGGHEFDTDAA